MPGAVLGPGNIMLIKINTVVEYGKIVTAWPLIKKPNCEAICTRRKCTKC